MIKKTITYTDYNGTERTEDYYFHLTEAEIMEMSLGVDGGLEQMIRRIIAAQDVPQLVATFKDILLRSYGEKSPDGKRFIKTPEVREAFTQTEAYSKLFMELATDAEAATTFMNGVIPADLRKQLPQGSPAPVK